MTNKAKKPVITSVDFGITGKLKLGVEDFSLNVLLTGESYLARVVYTSPGHSPVRESTKACKTPKLALAAAEDLLPEVAAYADEAYPLLAKSLGKEISRLGKTLQSQDKPASLSAIGRRIASEKSALEAGAGNNDAVGARSH